MYTDKELIRVSQIAYFTINREVINEVFDTVNYNVQQNNDM